MVLGGQAVATSRNRRSSCFRPSRRLPISCSTSTPSSTLSGSTVKLWRSAFVTCRASHTSTGGISSWRSFRPSSARISAPIGMRLCTIGSGDPSPTRASRTSISGDVPEKRRKAGGRRVRFLASECPRQRHDRPRAGLCRLRPHARSFGESPLPAPAPHRTGASPPARARGITADPPGFATSRSAS